MGTYLLGIDISTTATKALLIDEAGAVVAVGVSEYAFETPRPQWSEQDPALWWQGLVDSVRAVMAEAGVPPEDIAGIGLTGQMHGLVLLDETGAVLRPSILWNDQRTAAECAEIDNHGEEGQWQQCNRHAVDHRIHQVALARYH